MCVFSIPQLNVKFRFDGVPRRNTMHEAHNTYYVNAKFIYVSIERMKKKEERNTNHAVSVWYLAALEFGRKRDKSTN